MIPIKTNLYILKNIKDPFSLIPIPLYYKLIQWRLSILLQMLWQLLRIYGCYPCPCNRLGMAEYSYIHNDTNHRCP